MSAHRRVAVERGIAERQGRARRLACLGRRGAEQIDGWLGGGGWLAGAGGVGSICRSPACERQQRVANVPEPEILERLLKECREFQAKVLRGEAKLGEKKVDIVPPDPIGELGSGFEKIAAHQVERVATLTVGGR